MNKHCSYCDKVDELRPYGKNAALICFDCGMLTEHISETEQQFSSQIDACMGLTIIGEESGPRPFKTGNN